MSDIDKPGVTRQVLFEPGYSRRQEGYGVHGMHIRFVMVAPAGAVQFTLNTGWVPGEKMSPRTADYYPSAWDLGYHWPQPQYAGQTQMEECDLLGGPCYYDGSGLNAEPVMEAFIRAGADAVWDALDDYYRHLTGRVAS